MLLLFWRGRGVQAQRQLIAFLKAGKLVGLKPYYPPNNLDLLLESQYFVPGVQLKS
jgi:hypothetical protein